MRKKIISLVLLFTLFAPAIVTYSWLHYKKHAVKREVKWRILKGVDKAELTALTFTKAQASALNWKHSREFECRGNMYDIVAFEETQNGITYWCYNDREEAELETQIGNLTEALFNTDPQNKEQEQRLIQFYKTLYNQTPSAPNKSQFVLLESHPDYYSKKELTGFTARFLRPPASCYHNTL